MDTDRFDELIKDLAATRTRRGVFRLLAALPLAGSLATRRSAAIEAAGLAGPDIGQQFYLANDKPPKPCKPKKISKTCAGRCGSVTDNCGDLVECDPCPTTCAESCTLGCCTTAGECLDGSADDACGAAGNACRDCAAEGQVCASGQCQPAQTCVAGSCAECQRCNNTGTACEAAPDRVNTLCLSVTCEEAGTVPRCTNGQCQCVPDQACRTGTCPECQRCNADVTACEIDVPNVPCISVTCEEAGTVAKCTGGQCQCVPEQACHVGACPECQDCNADVTACEPDPSRANTICVGVTCEAGTEPRCTAGECQCQPEQACHVGTCPECQDCNADVTACEPAGAAEGTPCSSATCETGTEPRCSTGQCQCQAAEPVAAV